MASLPIKKDQNGEGESVTLTGSFRSGFWGFSAFLICCALLVAAFAVSAVWMGAGGKGWFSGLEDPTDSKIPTPTDPVQDGDLGARPPTEGTTDESPADEGILQGMVRIATLDLCRSSLGEDYVHNETAYELNVRELRAMEPEPFSNEEGPVVLILHTHTTESYLSGSPTHIEGAIGDLTYSDDPTVGVLSVGEALRQRLNEYGIPAIHCTLHHDDPTLRGAYERSAETVKAYLERYPSIRYVIDLHRDSVTNAAGEPIRSLASGTEAPTAQVMAVVGTDGNGTPCPAWQQNLALALRLQSHLNREGATVCRPVTLRNASYNQELSPSALLLEIGTAANSPEEARRAVLLVGDALAEILKTE